MADDLSELGGESAGGAGRGAGEAAALGYHQESIARVLYLMERQRYWLRAIACGVALLVAAAAGYLEWKLLKYILAPCSQASDLFVLLAISPIASITLILIFVLIGVFRGFRESDLNALPLETAGKVTFGNDS